MCGDGYGSGDGYSYGYGDGSGYGYGDGDGYGSDAGYGDGSGSGSGYVYGYGYGCGCVYGDGDGDGYYVGDGLMESTEWMTVPQSSDERQQSARYLAIEVRIYEEDGTLYAEPVYYKLMEDGTAGAAILMDGSYASREADRMWNYMRFLVEGEYTSDVLADIREQDPAFAALRREDQIQRRMYNEWYRRSVL